MSAYRITIDEAWCKGCAICVAFCPRQVLAVDGARWVAGHHPVLVKQVDCCTACRTCELMCPDMAIEVITDGQEGR